MHTNLKIPTPPAIDIYQLRYKSNNINTFNKNIINYDYIIYERIQKIAMKTEELNEIVRNAIPLLKIKLSYITHSELNENSTENHDNNNLEDIQKKILIANYIEDLMDVKLDLEKVISKMKYTNDSLLIFDLIEPNKLKLSQYINQKEALVTSKNSKQAKIDEINHEYSIITAAEDIILKTKISDFFNRYLLGKELIDTLELPVNKKQILKSTISYVRNLLAVIDNGLEFSQLVHVRLYLSDKIIALKEELNIIDTNISRLSQLIPLANEITTIDTYRLSVTAQIELLKNYWLSWCTFINEQASEQRLNIALINTASQMLETYLNDVEYQYHRQLPDSTG
ncbi:alpha-xenorhabdolysin family binary toxin subunit B [Providencia sp. Me31A]|uniref:alpha-xenorhabdolysin family binary toxin subunit B n=1 Tax=Providencia sp. Me31A TaxID=3392637 RepID=UPI003D2AC02A